MEPPTVRDATLSLANRYPFTDTLEVFKSHPATGAFGLRDQGCSVLLLGWLELDHQRPVHVYTPDSSMGIMEGWKPPFLPTPEGGGFRAA